MTSTDPALWCVAAAFVALDALAVWRNGWTIDPVALLAIVTAVAAFVVIARIAERDARLARLASPCYALALFCVLANASWIATYVAATSPAPLRDDAFRAADAVLGFSWPAWAAWSVAHPRVHTATAWAYGQHIREGVGLVAVLAWRRPNGAGPLLRALTLGVLVTTLIAALVPAVGAQADAAWLPTFTALRSGAFNAIGAGAVHALVTMPSFHAVLAVLFTVAAWTVPWLRWPAVALNGVMLVGTVRWGEHYLVDVLAGIALALLAAWATGMHFTASPRASPRASCRIVRTLK